MRNPYPHLLSDVLQPTAHLHLIKQQDLTRTRHND
jgi:hypothetical protein